MPVGSDGLEEDGGEVGGELGDEGDFGREEVDKFEDGVFK